MVEYYLTGSEKRQLEVLNTADRKTIASYKTTLHDKLCLKKPTAYSPHNTRVRLLLHLTSLNATSDCNFQKINHHSVISLTECDRNKKLNIAISR